MVDRFDDAERCRRNPVRPERSTENRTRVAYESLRGPVDLLDLHPTVQSGQPAQLFGDQVRLEGPLGRERGVLPVASPAAARTGVRAGGDTRSGEGSRTSTASALKNEEDSAVTCARTRSPGSA